MRLLTRSVTLASYAADVISVLVPARDAEATISADRPFTIYADGDPIGELPVRVRALPGAVTVLTPASGSAALS